MKKDELIKVIDSVEKESDIIQAIYLMFGKSVKIELEFSATACSASIDDISFSVRSLNALKRANVFTIQDLLNVISSGELKNVRNLGAKSYNEIQTKLLVYGFDKLSDAGKMNFYSRLADLNLNESDR